MRHIMAFMSTKSVNVNLDPGNLIWLKAQAIASGRRSLSEVLNEVIVKVRTGGRAVPPEVKSVVGKVTISKDDPDLEGADEAVRALFREPSSR